MTNAKYQKRTPEERGLILCRSDQGDGGWSLHVLGTSDEDIAEGKGLILSGRSDKDIRLNTWGRPNERDFQRAAKILARLKGDAA
jgi:hypothetical protein